MVDPVAAFQWILTPPNRLERLRYFVFRVRHHNIPGFLGKSVSVKGIILAFLIFGPILAISIAPFWIYALVSKSIPLNIVYYLTATIVLLQLISWVARRYDAETGLKEQEREHLDEFSLRLHQIFNEVFDDIPKDCFPDNSEWRARIFEKILACVVSVAEYNLNTPNKSLQGSLIGFDGASDAIIIARARSDRPVGVKTNRENVIGYYVARCGKTFIVHDILKQSIFPHRGLTQEKLRYRSILVVPIEVELGDEKRSIGVITVDSKRPYEFWGAAGDSVATQLIPFVRILVELMNEHYVTLAIDRGNPIHVAN